MPESVVFLLLMSWFCIIFLLASIAAWEPPELRLHGNMVLFDYCVFSVCVIECVSCERLWVTVDFLLFEVDNQNWNSRKRQRPLMLSPHILQQLSEKRSSTHGSCLQNYAIHNGSELLHLEVKESWLTLWNTFLSVRLLFPSSLYERPLYAFNYYLISSSEAFGCSLWHQRKRAHTDTLTHTCDKTKSDTVMRGNTNTLWIKATFTCRRESLSRRGQSHLRSMCGRKTGDDTTRWKDCGVLWPLHASRFGTVTQTERAEAVLWGSAQKTHIF